MVRNMARKRIRVATVILAGGQGTRLHPLTIHHCKPAVCYGGRYRLIDIPISNSINSGLRQIYVIAQYLAGELQHHITQTYRFDSFQDGSIDVLTPQENSKGEKEWFQGTADAVRKNLPTLLDSPADLFLILSGDQLYNINFQEMIEFARKSDADLTIASLPVTDKEAARMGVLKTDDSGRVLDFVEKPKESATIRQFHLPQDFYAKSNLSTRAGPHCLGSMGIYIFKRDTLISLLERDKREDFGYHLISTAVKEGKTYSYLYDGYWEDIGTVASFFEANLLLTRRSGGLDVYDERNPIYSLPMNLPGPSFGATKIIESIVCDGSLVEADEINKSIIGVRSNIGKGSIIRESVILGNHQYSPLGSNVPLTSGDFGIGHHCRMERVILDEQVRIGNHVSLTNTKKLDRYEGHGVYIRDGIIIVTAGTVVPDHFTL